MDVKIIIIGFSYLYGFLEVLMNFYRINVEEDFMIEQMGERYLDYQKRTKRMIPMVY